MFKLAFNSGKAAAGQKSPSINSELMDEVQLARQLRRKFYFACFTHCLMILYGIAVFAITILH